MDAALDERRLLASVSVGLWIMMGSRMPAAAKIGGSGDTECTDAAAVVDAAPIYGW